MGLNHVHPLVDHCRYACCEILVDEQGPAAAGFLSRVLDHFAGIEISAAQ